MEQARKLEFLLDDLGVDGADSCDGTILNTTYIAEKILEAGWTLPVRCKECKHWKRYGPDLDGLASWGKCLLIDMDVDMPANGYCCFGERKEE